MNLDYLGDALDHWKGSVFAFLQGEGALRNLAVDAMATDASPWNAGDFAVYARLLRVRDDQIIRHSFPLVAGALAISPRWGIAVTCSLTRIPVSTPADSHRSRSTSSRQTLRSCWNGRGPASLRYTNTSERRRPASASTLALSASPERSLM